MFKLFRNLTAIFIFCLTFTLSAQTTYTISNTNNTGAGSLRDAITAINTAGSGNYIIDMTGISGTITLTSLLPPINYNTVINGPGKTNLTISGGNTYRVFFIGAGTSPFTTTSPANPTVEIKDLTISNGKGKGGNGIYGGGGGAGMGGAIFLNLGTVTVSNVNFTSNSAIGGAGSTNTASGGYFAGGGGGFSGNAANGSGQTGGNGGSSGYLGGAGGQGLFNSSGTPGGDGGGGGGGGFDGSITGRSGGPGGFGAGGGGGSLLATGTPRGGNGGFGGGAGAANKQFASPGYAGGDDAVQTSGNGAGLGGAIFQKAGTLSLENCTFTSNSAAAGTGGNGGTSIGGAIFIYGGNYLLNDVTYSSNTAASSSDLFNYGGTQFYDKPTGSILSVNSPSFTSIKLNTSVNPHSKSVTYAKIAYGTTSGSLLDSITVTPTLVGESGSSAIVSSTIISGLISKELYFFTLTLKSDGKISTTPETKYFNDNPIPKLNLSLWLRADKGVEHSANSISLWKDLSGNGNDVVQSTATAKPTFVSNSQNSLPTVQFDGTSDYMTTVGNVSLGTQTTIIAVSYINSAAGYMRLLHANSNAYILFGYNNNVFTSNYGNGTAWNNLTANGGGTVNGTWKIITSVVNGTNDLSYQNGVALAAKGAGKTASNAGLVVGAYTDGTTQWFNGKLAELIVYNRALSAAERISVENYLAMKWGIGQNTSAAPSVTSNTTGIFTLGTTGATVNFTTGSSTGGNISTSTSTNPTVVGGLPSGVSTLSPNKYWTINNSGLTGFTYNITLDLSDISGIADFDSIKVLKRADSSSPWQNVAKSPINATVTHNNPYITITGLTSFSEFAIGGGAENQLPVELTDFSSSVNGNTVILNWQTKTETNNYGFEIQKSVGNSQNSAWEKVGFVNGKGTTTEKQTYSFKTLINQNLTRLQFRLKQIDLDGKFDYSNILEIQTKPNEFSLSQNYPNPFNPSTEIKFSLPVQGFISLKVYDLLGREVLTLVNGQKDSGNHSVKIDAVKLTSGVYFYKLTSGSFSQTRKMTIMK